MRKKKLCPLTHSPFHTIFYSVPSTPAVPLIPYTLVQQLEVSGRWTQKDNRQSDRQADEPSLLIPVYSKWKPAADTLMSDWKVRYRLLDVLFSSWGIVVPES